MPKPVVLKPLEVGLDGRIETFAFEREGEEEEEPVAMDFSRKPGVGGVETKKEEMKVAKPLDWKSKSGVVAEKKQPVLMDFFGMGELDSFLPSSVSSPWLISR